MMRNILKFGIISVAMVFGLILVSPDTASAQNRGSRASREYRKDVREARRDYNRRVRNGDYRKARREYREDIVDARRDYYRNVRRGQHGWYYYQNNRRYYRPYSSWTYRNGRFYRRSYRRY